MGAFKKFVTWLNGEDDDDEDLDAEYDEEYEDEEEEGEAKPSFFARLKTKVFPKRTNAEDEDEAEDEEEAGSTAEPARSNLASQNTLLTAGAYNSVRKSETNYANTVNRQAAASNQFSHASQQTAFQPKHQQTSYQAATSTATQQPSYPQKTPFAPAKDRTAALNPTANAPQKQFSVMKPTSFEDSSSIVDVLRNGKAIIVNFEGSNPAISQRIMDFVCGCIYTIDGQILQISGYIFIVAPKDMDITGDYTAFLQQDSFGVPTFRQ